MKCHFEKKIGLFMVLFCFICLCGCGSKHEDTTPVGGWIEGEDTPSSSDQITDTAATSESGEGESSTQAEKGESEGQVFLCFELINYEWLRLALEPLDMSGTDNPLEAGKVHEVCGKEFLTVTPGVRFADGEAGDQKRIMTPAQAKEIGSDYIVVGRPITAAPDPVAAYNRCVAEFCD